LIRGENFIVGRRGSWNTLKVASIQKKYADAGHMQMTTQTIHEPESGMGLLNVVAHLGAEPIGTGLFLMPAGCVTNDACKRDLFISQDSGRNWDDHIINEEYSSLFHYEVTYDAWGIPGTDTVLLGTF
jgi:hypothetical protein